MFFIAAKKVNVFRKYRGGEASPSKISHGFAMTEGVELDRKLAWTNARLNELAQNKSSPRRRELQKNILQLKVEYFEKFISFAGKKGASASFLELLDGQLTMARQNLKGLK